jgi:uncharacterized protein with NRDE domain
MCTVSWLHSGSGYQLLCNRDERNTRRVASAPTLHERDGVRFIAPLDGDHGGTWIATNEFGLTLALINGVRPLEPAPRSRGHLVMDLASTRSANDVATRIGHAHLELYGPFTLVAVQSQHPAALFEWDGNRLTTTMDAEGRMPLASSSYDPEGVRSYRRKEFQRFQSAAKLTAEILFTFHQSHGSGPSAYSTCMHRTDAQTVSFTWIDVTEHNVRFFYSPAAPCQWAPGETLELMLRDQAVSARSS